MLDAIPTLYNHVQFRSRLEAKWALFWDLIKRPWQYEPQGFKTSDGNYLPDFHLPKIGHEWHDLWVEVKPPNILPKSETIYAGGKINKNGWRDGLCPKARDGAQEFNGGAEVLAPWPIYRIPDTPHWYSGPYFISCDHGCAHTDSGHGVGALPEGAMQHGMLNEKHGGYFEVDVCVEHGMAGCICEGLPERRTVVSNCRDAIRECSIFFAWLDSPDAYGTLVELGQASALNKKIIIAHPHNMDTRLYQDLWFARYCASKVVIADDPLTGLRVGLGRDAWQPIEMRKIVDVARCRNGEGQVVYGTPAEAVLNQSMPYRLREFSAAAVTASIHKFA